MGIPSPDSVEGGEPPTSEEAFAASVGDSVPGTAPSGDAPPAILGERLPKHSRICKRNDFGVVFRGGVRIRNGVFNGVVMPTDRGYSRLGLAVSRRVGNAVKRNLVKRRIRELFRRNRALLPPSADLVVIPQPGVGALDFAAFRAQLLGLFERACNPGPLRKRRPRHGRGKSTARGRSTPQKGD